LDYKTIYIVLILLAGSFFNQTFAQNEVKDNGYNIFYYPNGQISSEGNMRDGKPDGYWKTYYVTGITKSEGNRKNFLLDSVWTFYNNAGKVVEKIPYLLGKINGYKLTIKYDNDNPMEEGYIASKELYVNGKKEGISYYYHKTGHLKEEINYVDNKKSGLSKEYNNKGNLVTINEYRRDILISRERLNRFSESGNKEGLWREYYDNGKVKKEMYFKNDELDGLIKEFEENGALKVALRYKDGDVVSDSITLDENIEVRTEYNENEQLTFRGTYKNGVPFGVHQYFDTIGNVIKSIVYSEQGLKIGEGIIDKEGKKQSAWKYFFNTGVIKAQGEYKEGKRTGSWSFFYEDGNTEQKGTYADGRKGGSWKWYYPDGSVKREESFYMGYEDGYYVEYDKAGNIIVEGEYIDGEREGKWLYDVGDHIEKGKYIIGLKDGLWQYFYKNGNIAYEGEYIQGNPDGKHRFYYEDGTLKEEQIYVMGIKEKNWKKYDKNGDLYMIITYKDNREYRVNGVKIEYPDENVTLIQ